MHTYWIIVDGCKIEEVQFSEKPSQHMLNAVAHEFNTKHGICGARVEAL